MKIKITFEHFPASSKSIRVAKNKMKYMCAGKRLPKFIWDRL